MARRQGKYSDSRRGQDDRRHVPASGAAARLGRVHTAGAPPVSNRSPMRPVIGPTQAGCWRWRAGAVPNAVPQRLPMHALRCCGLGPRGDGREWPDQQLLARKAADAVVEQRGVLLAMPLRKKGAEGVDVCLTRETIHRGPPVAWLPLPPHRGFYHDKKREQTVRKDHGGPAYASWQCLAHIGRGVCPQDARAIKVMPWDGRLRPMECSERRRHGASGRGHHAPPPRPPARIVPSSGHGPHIHRRACKHVC